MKSILAAAFGCGVLLFVSDFAAAVQPREVHRHSFGTSVTYALYSVGKPVPVKVPQAAADRVIAFANQIKPHTRPVAVRRVQPAPIGSFTIGKKTWLHLHKGGRLEDPSYQGIQAQELKRLVELLEVGGKADETFLRWAEELADSETRTQRRAPED